MVVTEEALTVPEYWASREINSLAECLYEYVITWFKYKDKIILEEEVEVSLAVK